MRMRIDRQRDEHEQATAGAPTGGPAATPGRRGGVTETSLDGFMLQFPGAVSRVKIPKGGSGD